MMKHVNVLSSFCFVTIIFCKFYMDKIKFIMDCTVTTPMTIERYVSRIRYYVVTTAKFKCLCDLRENKRTGCLYDNSDVGSAHVTKIRYFFCRLI